MTPIHCSNQHPAQNLHNHHKQKGESGSPCRNPRVLLEKPDRVPLIFVFCIFCDFFDMFPIYREVNGL